MDSASRFLSLRTKLMVAFALLALVTVGVSSYLYYRNARAQLWTDVRERLRDSVAIAALQVDAQKHATLTEPSQEGSSTYMEIKRTLQKIRDAGTKIEYVYTMRLDAQGNIVFVVDAEESEENVSHLGDIYKDPGPVLAANFPTMAQPMTENDFYTDEWGAHLSGYAPFYGPDGKREGILGMDISATDIVALQEALLTRAIVIFVVFGFLAALIGLLLGFALTQPIFVLTEGAKKLAAGDFSQRIVIHTHDEIEVLANAFNATASELGGLITRLEQRVQERTDALSRRTSHLNAAAQVARQATAIKDPGELVQNIVHLISDQFGFYHVGIFLLDEMNEYAMLVAASSEGGQRMLARGHRLKVGEQGIVGFAAAQRRPRIVLNTGTDAVFFDNPDLPTTQSEAALPLIVRNKVLGVLDIQSENLDAFTQEDVDIFQTLADQLAVAIESARVFSDMEALLQQMQQIAGEQTAHIWAGQSGNPVYQYTPLGIQRIPEMDETQEDAAALKTSILLRGRKIGSLLLKRKKPTGWSDQEQAMLQELASQVALALENARLLEDAQMRAVRERSLAEITSRIGSALDVDSVLRTTAQEIGRALGDVEVSVHLHEEDRPIGG